MKSDVRDNAVTCLSLCNSIRNSPTIRVPHHATKIITTYTVNQQILAAIKFGVSQNKVIWRLLNLASPHGSVYAVYDRRRGTRGKKPTLREKCNIFVNIVHVSSILKYNIPFCYSS